MKSSRLRVSVSAFSSCNVCCCILHNLLMQTELDKREEYIPQQPTCCGKKKRRGDEGSTCEKCSTTKGVVSVEIYRLNLAC